MKMTPLKVEILLHYYHSPDDFKNLDAPAIKEAIDEFERLGILYWRIDQHCNSQNKVGYHQEALDAYVNAILEVPLPIRTWIVPKI